jgi:hypothetical protein
MAGHIETTHKQIQEERGGIVDGLMQRILVCAPRPLFRVSFKDIREAPNPEVSIEALLFCITYMYESDVTLKFSNEAHELLDGLMDDYKHVIELSNNIDQFLS